jgi:hypothetical protein
LSSVVCLGFITGLRESLSTSTQMTQMEQIAADQDNNLRQSAGDLWQSAFYFSTFM